MNGGEGADAEVGGVAEDSMPPWPASRLKAQANSAAISICTAATSWPGGSQGQRAQRGHAQDQQQREGAAGMVSRLAMPVLPSGPKA